MIKITNNTFFKAQERDKKRERKTRRWSSTMHRTEECASPP
jgi:hypothetical protein